MCSLLALNIHGKRVNPNLIVQRSRLFFFLLHYIPTWKREGWWVLCGLCCMSLYRILCRHSTKSLHCCYIHFQLNNNNNNDTAEWIGGPESNAKWVWYGEIEAIIQYVNTLVNIHVRRTHTQMHSIGAIDQIIAIRIYHRSFFCYLLKPNTIFFFFLYIKDDIVYTYLRIMLAVF